MVAAGHQNDGGGLVHANGADRSGGLDTSGHQHVLLQATDHGYEKSKAGPLGAGRPAGLHQVPEDGILTVARLLEPDATGDDRLNDGRVAC
jgi:hypothetical protein